MWWRSPEGSTARLGWLCLGYFAFYTVYMVTVTYMIGRLGMKGVAFLVYSTAGGNIVCMSVALFARWYRLRSIRPLSWAGLELPAELLYIVPSGLCTAVVIPTTTLLYMIPGVSIMVATVIMRGSVIVVSRLVDELQVRQGILKKRVYLEENLAVIFAIAAVSVHLLMGGAGNDGITHPAALVVLGSYVVAYLFRIYIMNYYKNTRPPGTKLDNKAFFAIEQIAATGFIVTGATLIYYSPELWGWAGPRLNDFRGAILEPHPDWTWALLAGGIFGVVAFFSVFLFMFKGRTATFAGLVNRLTSLLAGTASTLAFALLFGGVYPKQADWVSLGLVLVAVAFLAAAERKRVGEMGFRPPASDLRS